MTSTFKFLRWILGVIPFATAVLPRHALAEYRCASPEQLTNAETRACELARQDSPGALIHFVNRTKGSYNLYVDDYVGQADLERWKQVKHDANEDSPAIVNVSGDSTDALKKQ